MEAKHDSLSPRIPVELPFDVLGVIFAYYVDSETLFHPLETLLLVSRQWNFAALGHKALWGDIHIHLGHKPTHDAWKAILLRRLECAGSAPLRIEIRYALESVGHPYYQRTSTCPWEEETSQVFIGCSCIGYAAGCAQDLLDILTGPRGEYCKRWTKLHITLGGIGTRRREYNVRQFHPSLLCDSLSHPMPLLESIYLKGLDVLRPTSRVPFPSIPSVRIVHFEACIFNSLDGVNFSSAQSIIFQDVGIIHQSSKFLKFNPPTLIQLIHMDKVYPLASEIIGSLPHLHTLYLGEYVDNITAPDSDFPSLKTLTVPVAWAYGRIDSIFFERLTCSTYHPLSNVQVLTIPQTRPCAQQLMTSLKPFLEELESIEKITGSREVLGVTLKYILEANMQREGSRIWSNLSGRTLELIHFGEGSTAQLMFEEKMCDVDICAAGRILGVLDLTIPWEQYLKNL